MNALAVAQTVEPVPRAVLNVEMLAPDILKTLLEMQDGPWIHASDMAGCLAVLVPAPTSIGPYHPLQEFLGVDVVVVHGLALDIN